MPVPAAFSAGLAWPRCASLCHTSRSGDGRSIAPRTLQSALGGTQGARRCVAIIINNSENETVPPAQLASLGGVPGVVGMVRASLTPVSKSSLYSNPPGQMWLSCTVCQSAEASNKTRSGKIMSVSVDHARGLCVSPALSILVGGLASVLAKMRSHAAAYFGLPPPMLPEHRDFVMSMGEPSAVS
jgi:hypothetical protein